MTAKRDFVFLSLLSHRINMSFCVRKRFDASRYWMRQMMRITELIIDTELHCVWYWKQIQALSPSGLQLFVLFGPSIFLLLVIFFEAPSTNQFQISFLCWESAYFSFFMWYMMWETWQRVFEVLSCFHTKKVNTDNRLLSNFTLTCSLGDNLKLPLPHITTTKIFPCNQPTWRNQTLKMNLKVLFQFVKQNFWMPLPFSQRY